MSEETNMAMLLGMGYEITEGEFDQPLKWRTISCADYEVLLGNNPQLKVWSSLTDPEGIYGEPQFYTLWGQENAMLLSTLLEYPHDDKRKSCSHAVATPKCGEKL